jgi:hypothetical protein
MVFSPDLLDLVEGNLSLESALKYDFDEDPDKLVVKFINALETLHTSHIFRRQAHKDIPSLTEEQQQAYNSATVCEKCGRQFTSQEPKVRHHDHTTSKYIGPWCRRCNLLEGRRHFQTIVIFHNFRGYDSHFIIRYGLKYIQDKIKKDAEISSDKHVANLKSITKQFSITKYSEKFSCLQFGYFKFLDSYLHLSDSLDNLIEQLKKSTNGNIPLADKASFPEIL